MKSRKPLVMLFSALVSAIAFAAAPSLLARGGGGGGAGTGGNRGEGGAPGEPDDGSQPPPEEQIGGFGTGSGSKTPGGIDFGADGAEQADIARDVFERMASNAFNGFRDDRNRRSADPSAPGR